MTDISRVLAGSRLNLWYVDTMGRARWRDGSVVYALIDMTTTREKAVEARRSAWRLGATTYEDWMLKYVSQDPDAVLGMCYIMVESMIDVFPELVRVRGRVVLSSGQAYTHFWAETPDGRRIDPTAHQFHGLHYDEDGETYILAYARTEDESALGHIRSLRQDAGIVSVR